MHAYKSIVLSGNPGAGKSALAAALSKEYGWPIYSIGGLWREKYKEEHPGNDITFEEFWSRTTKEDNVKVNKQAKVIFEKGGVIGESRYTAILDASVCLLVFVTADMATRAMRTSGREEYRGMSVQEITKILERREQDELDMGHELYGMGYDYRDSKNYHIVIDSERLTVAQEVALVKGLMRK
jgi:cytidylate kinase